MNTMKSETSEIRKGALHPLLECLVAHYWALCPFPLLEATTPLGCFMEPKKFIKGSSSDFTITSL